MKYLKEKKLDFMTMKYMEEEMTEEKIKFITSLVNKIKLN